MKKYKIVVNGTAYEVELEEISEAEAKTEKTAPAQAPVKPVSGKGEPVPAPIPGTVLSLNFRDGDNVKEGDVVLVLESMKMENEIVAPVSGKITYHTTKGASVNAEDVLCTLA